MFPSNANILLHSVLIYSDKSGFRLILVVSEIVSSIAFTLTISKIFLSLRALDYLKNCSCKYLKTFREQKILLTTRDFGLSSSHYTTKYYILLMKICSGK